jgi:lysozyme family protein
MGTSNEINGIITDIIKAEGGATATNRPNDRGGRTQYGISEKSNPQAWLDGRVTEPEAREIYEKKYVKAPGFDKIADPKLQAQLVDFGVTSGPQLAIQKLQGCVGAAIDGILGPETLAKVNAAEPVRLNNQLALERVKMIGRLVHRDPRQSENLNGWLTRALGFFRL